MHLREGPNEEHSCERRVGKERKEIHNLAGFEPTSSWPWGVGSVTKLLVLEEVVQNFEIKMNLKRTARPCRQNTSMKTDEETLPWNEAAKVEAKNEEHAEITHNCLD